MDAGVGQRDHQRRRRRRRTPGEHGVTSARVRPGHDVLVIDISADGALVETAYRLLPGRVVELQLDLITRRIAVRGRVLRCAVAAVRPWTVVYRAVILFDSAVGCLREDDENEVPFDSGAPWASVTRNGE